MRVLSFQIFFTVFFLGALLGRQFSDERELVKFEASLKKLQAFVKADTERQVKQEKVIRIIDSFNPSMPLAMKQEIAGEIYNMSIKYPNLDVELLCATITHESARTWDPSVVSKAGAIGLMQIMPATGEWLAKYENFKWQSAEETLVNPIYNIRMGSRYLSALIETYELDGGLAAYNGGEKRVGMWLAQNKLDSILWPETRKYVPSVLELYEEFRN
ncbi:lytic transglycosylase domain-containing protein [candidate division KSB1 bacterium]|nr:lytic transglycosylase domain-containing protein [candidate division KSB1 bacterium]